MKHSLSIKTFCSILAGIMISVLIQGQQNEVLLTIDEKDISQDEFLWMYHKNSSSSDELSAKDYLDTYIEFQLKVRDAERMGLDTASAFREEIREYEDQLIRSYLPQEPTLNMLVQEAYDRMKFDINASHILIRVSPGASPADTLQAWNKISELRKRILEGEDFAKVARENSEDPAAKVNGGKLNYFTVLTMVYPVETAAYETAPGTISQPFRSTMGYHILKVNDRRPGLGRLRLAHIYVATVEKNGDAKDQESRDEARVKIFKAFEELTAGVPFKDAVAVYSEEPGAEHTGGELPVFGVGQMDPAFEEAAYSLGGPRSFSRPFETVFGWHIVFLLEKIPIGSFRTNKEDLESRVISDRRPEYHHMLHIERVKRHYGFAAYPEQLEMIFSEGDSSLLAGEWEAGDLVENRNTLLTIGNSDKSIGDFAAFIEQNQSGERRARDPRFYMTELYHQFIEKTVLDHEYNMVAEEHPETSFLLGEYRNGMLLFEISNLKVWSRALSDTAGLNSFFQNHRDLYMWGERYDAWIVTSNEGADVDKVRKTHKKIQSGAYDAVKLNDKFCDNDSVACIHLAHVITEKGVYERIDQMNGAIGPGPVYDSKVTLGFVIINKVLPPEPKQLSEVRGQVVSDYQIYLEKMWVEELRQSYPVTIRGF